LSVNLCSGGVFGPAIGNPTWTSDTNENCGSGSNDCSTNVGHMGNTNLCGYTIVASSPAGVIGSIGVDEAQYTAYVSSSSSTGSVTVRYTVPSTQSGKAFVGIIGACGNGGYCIGLSTDAGCSGITLVNSTTTEGASGGGIAEAICYQSAGSYTAVLTYSNPGGTTFGSLGVYVYNSATTSTSTTTTSTTTTTKTTTKTISFTDGSVYGNVYIELANGIWVPASTIKVGDAIMSYNFKTGKLEPSVVTDVTTFISNNTYVFNGNLRVDENEVLYINGKWMRAKNAKIGDKLYNPEYGNVTIYSIRRIPNGGVVYDVLATPNNNYIADGYVIDRLETD